MTDTAKSWWAVSERSRKGRAHLWRLQRTDPKYAISYCGKSDRVDRLQNVDQALVGCKICAKTQEPE